LITLRKQEDNGGRKLKHHIASYGQLALEEAVDLSKDRTPDDAYIFGSQFSFPFNDLSNCIIYINPKGKDIY
jgi:hypothetical protein